MEGNALIRRQPALLQPVVRCNSALPFAQPVMAQSVNTYVVTNDGRNRTETEPAPTRWCATSMSPDSFTSYRCRYRGACYNTHGAADLQITLVSPDGTRVQLTNGDTQSTSGDNFNVVLDDAAPQLCQYRQPGRENHAGTAPPFQNRFRSAQWLVGLQRAEFLRASGGWEDVRPVSRRPMMATSVTQ